MQKEWEKRARRLMREPRKPRKKFTSEEDSILVDFVEKNGADGWHRVIKQLPGRTARQCRERWKNYLSPDVERKPWTEDEDNLIVSLVQQYGQQWSKLAKYFAGRTDVTIKNRYALIRRHIVSGVRTQKSEATDDEEKTKESKKSESIFPIDESYSSFFAMISEI